MEILVKLVKESNPTGVYRKTLVVPIQLCLKFGANIKEIRWFKKKNIILEAYEAHQNNVLKFENVQ